MKLSVSVPSQKVLEELFPEAGSHKEDIKHSTEKNLHTVDLVLNVCAHEALSC